MRQIALIPFAVMFAAMLFAGHSNGEKPKSDHDLIQGKWKIVSAAEGGTVAKPEEYPFTHFEFTADTLSFWGKSERTAKPAAITLTYKLDASKQPKTMDTSHELDKGKPIIQLAIYALDGDELKLSLAPAGKPYPTKLESKGDWSFFVLKRVKKDEK